MNRRIALVYILLVASQLVHSQDRGLNGDVQQVFGHRDSPLVKTAIDLENSSVKQNQDLHLSSVTDPHTITNPDNVPKVDIRNLNPGAVPTSIAGASVGKSPERLNAQTNSEPLNVPGGSTSTVTLKTSFVTPAATGHGEPQRGVQESTQSALEKQSPSTTGGANTSGINPRFHQIQEVDNGFTENNEEAVTRASLAEQQQASLENSLNEAATINHVAQPTHYVQQVENTYVGNRQGTSTMLPDPAKVITPKPIIMLDFNSKSSALPNMDARQAAGSVEGETGDKEFPEPAKLLTRHNIHGDIDHNVTVSEDNNTYANPRMVAAIEMPPLNVPGRFSDLKSRHFKVRRKKRSVDDVSNGRQQTDGEESTSVFPKSYIWGIIGWIAFAFMLWLYVNERLGLWSRMRKFCRRRRRQDLNDSTNNINPEDLESAPQAHSWDENKEITIYEKKGRNPSGHGIVRFHEDVELIDETFLNEGLVNLPPQAPSVFNVIQEENFYFYDSKMSRFERRASEKVKVIRRLSSATGTASFKDELCLAKEVIMDVTDKDAKLVEKRKVIREATANERKGSLQEEIEFAKSVIVPSAVVKELDEEALHRRQLIKEQTSDRRSSLLDDITKAREVLGVASEVAP